MDSTKIANEQLLLFQGILPTQTAAMLNCLGGYTRKYDRGEYIFLDEESIDCIGIVLSGTVHMCKEDVWGNQALLCFMGPGELFGESFALRKDQNSSVSFLAASKCEVLLLPGKKVLHPCKYNCPFHRRMIENMFDILGLKNQRLMEKIEITSQKTLRDKILAFFSREAQINGSSTFTIQLSRTQMADYLCANRSALYRELSAMEDEGLISVNGRQFTLHIDDIPVN